MTDPADLRFLEALRDTCHQFDDVDKDARQLIDRAIETGEPLDLMAVRMTLGELDKSLHDSLFQHVHLRMATDLSAIWDALPGALEKPRQN